MIRTTKRLFFSLIIVLLYAQTSAQEIVTLENVQEWTALNAPVFLQIGKYEQMSEIKQKDAIWNYLPKFEINGQATYQDPVLEIETDNHLLEQVFPVFPHDYYKFTLDLNMPIYDGGTTTNTKKYNKITSELDVANTEVALYSIKERVNQTYLNIFYSDENIGILDLYLESLERDIKQVKVLVENGVILPNNLDILEAQKLRIEQQKVELVFQRQYLVSVLGEFTGKDLSAATFTLPEIEISDMGLSSSHPEFQLFGLQIASLDYQKKLLNNQSNPKFNIFATGGYARSTYNFFDTDFGWQYMVGASLKIPLMNWFKTKMGREYINIQQDIIDLKRDDYKRNNRIQMLQKLADIDKYSQMIEQDDAIVEKCKKIIETSKTQLAEGVITANDYLKEMNNQTEALLKQQLHKLQLLQAKIDFNALKGDL